jgi:hypothetical protein
MPPSVTDVLIQWRKVRSLAAVHSIKLLGIWLLHMGEQK